jgi:predicted TIM-barrel fold metal-dependent hydrolase
VARLRPGERGREPGVRPLPAALAAQRDPRGRPADGPPASDPDLLRTQLLDPWRLDVAVTHCIYGIDGIHNPDWADAMARALNDWQHAEWLAGDRGCAARSWSRRRTRPGRRRRSTGSGDRPEFVQVLLPVRMRAPLGTRAFWPIYAAAERHGLALAVYAGGASGNPITPVGSPSYYLEEYVGLSQAFQAQVVSLVCEGVPVRFPALTVVLVESGFTWLPPLMWRLDKNWKGLRREVPWVDRLPSEMIRTSFRLTAQPIDAPDDDPARLLEVLDRLGSDRMLMFATDYPHHQFDDPAHARARGPVRRRDGPLPRRQRRRHLPPGEDGLARRPRCRLRHPQRARPARCSPYLSPRWRAYDETYGGRGDGGTPTRRARRGPPAPTRGRRRACRRAPTWSSCASSTWTPTTCATACSTASPRRAASRTPATRRRCAAR